MDKINLKSVYPLLKTHAFVFIFFVGLFFSLFLGDGKQGFVEVTTSGVIIVLYVTAFITTKKQRNLPILLLYVWIVLIGYYCISCILSINVSYSLSSTMRLIQGFLVFILFYEYGSEDTARLFQKGLLVISLLSTGFFVYFILFPKSAGFLPLMNLLYANYGHSHIVSLIVFIYPYTFISFLNKFRAKNFLLYGIVVITVAMSFSRGALLLLGLYTLIHVSLFSFRHSFFKKFIFSSISILMISIVFLLPVYISVTEKESSQNFITYTSLIEQWFVRQTDKPYPLNSRVQYGKQALTAFIEHPLLGYGPGTFSLLSKKYQYAPNQSSWFAHNSILEMMAETGVIGVSLMISILVITLHYINKQSQYLRNLFQSPLLMGTVLVLLSSLYDFSLNFLVIWLLMWSSLGVLMIPNKKVTTRPNLK